MPSEITHDEARNALKVLGDHAKRCNETFEAEALLLAYTLQREVDAQQRAASGAVRVVREALMLAQRDGVDSSDVHRACGYALTLLDGAKP